MAAIACFGSLNIDKVFTVPSIVKKGETIASTGYAEFAGGKGANQSVALARAASGSDIAVHHVGKVGRDGAWLVNLLDQNGINTTDIMVSDIHNTGCALIQKDAEGDNAIILLPGSNAKIPTWHIDNALSKFKQGDHLLIQNEINNVPDIITAAKDRGLKVVFNPAPCPANIAAYPLDCVDILILNKGEAEALFAALSNDPSHSVETILSILMKVFTSLEAVIITLGENGASAIYRDMNVDEKSNGSELDVQFAQVFALRDCQVVDTTGAGDTFVGYFLASFVSLKEKLAPDAFKKALEIAAVASGIACETNGAIPSIPQLDNVKKRMQ
ncbi:UNVERIFIED_CONTAM: hypothetical protein HDU68_010109 [Siphonaria sp. JEL0065]|nr:hypothetical protein HDU68_010109 [Siphonaria sp. JEL0065]